ncbi:MAG TPA: hypothetical protein VLW52_04380 [Opitutaceae bacterium]|nr:hypothetical protein [Opitutaceae bacterium]
MSAVFFHLPTRAARCAAALLAAMLALSGCVSTKYKMARKDTPPPVLLNLVAAQPPVEAVLNTVIICQGPGSWKRQAFWDEYVITVHNQGAQPLTIASATLTDFAGVSQAPGIDPWALEKQSKTLEQKYRDAGVAFVRTAGPGVVILGAGVAGVGTVGIFSASASGIAAGTLVALPVYYAAVWFINSENKAAVAAEFNRRRLSVPLTLAPGETRTGSLFFPMIPNPRSLSLRGSSGPADAAVVIPLETLNGLHVKTPARASARNQNTPPVCAVHNIAVGQHATGAG